MKKMIKLLTVPLLMFTFLAYADVIPIQILVKCDNALHPANNADVAISTSAEIPGEIAAIDYLTTDGSGYFYLNDSHRGKLVSAYLAQGRTIIADCRSRAVPVSSGKIILGEPGSSCPSSLCR